ncbi:hypothetical protein AB4Z50_33600 [Paenibacillus sp. 2TAB26]
MEEIARSLLNGMHSFSNVGKIEQPVLGLIDHYPSTQVLLTHTCKQVNSIQALCNSHTGLSSQ